MSAHRAGGLAVIVSLALTGSAWAQAPDVTVTNTPYNPPIVIPEAGGTFAYQLDVHNGEPTAQAFDLWTVYALPDGGSSGTVYGPVELTLPGSGWSAQNDLSQYLSGDQPAGTYTYTAFAGIWPDVVWSSSGFALEKLVGGIGWYEQTSGASHGLTAVWFVDADTGWVVSSYQEILHSIDGGDTWQPQDDGQYYPHEYNDVQFIDAQTGWVVGHGYSLGGTILHTIDGGVTWIEQGHEYTYELNSLSFADANNGWVAGGYVDTFGSDHRRIIEHTADGGETWVGQYWESYAYPLQAIFFPDANHGWAVGGPGGILATSNGGASWDEQNAGTVSYLEDVFFVDAQEGWCVGAGGTVLHTTNGGTTWQVRDIGTTAELRGLTFVDASNGWIVGVDNDAYRAVILHTSDGGDTWQAQDPGTGDAEVFLADVCFVDANNGWAAGEEFYDIPVLIHTENGGSSLIPGSVFSDDFESGDTSAWSEASP